MTLSQQKTGFRPGVTLVELVVAIALAALLMSALVGILRGISTQAKIADSFTQSIWQEQFTDIVYRDLLSAEAIWQSGDTVWFQGDAPCYLESGSGSRNVGYRCKKLSSGRSVLIRIDQDANGLIAIGPQKIAVERLDESGNPQPLPPRPGPVPGQIRVWVWEDDLSRPVLVRDLVAR